MNYDKENVENHRQMFLSETDSKRLVEFVYGNIYEHFSNYLTKYEHCFVRKRNKSVQTHNLLFPKYINSSLD